MWARLSIVAGLVAGIAVAALVLGGLVALTPGPTAPSTPAPARPTAIPSVIVSAAPDASPGPSGSLAPGASPSDASAAAPGAAAFLVGQPAPARSVVDAAGIVRDGALGGIGPDVMAAGSKTILPGVDATP